MKTKTDPTVAAEALRDATLKVAKLRRIVEAEEKLAHAAKVRFKGAKKTWKLARKTAKRSARKLKHAEKQLTALAKRCKHAKVKPEAKKIGALARHKIPSSRKNPAALRAITTATASTTAAITPGLKSSAAAELIQ